MPGVRPPSAVFPLCPCVRATPFALSGRLLRIYVIRATHSPCQDIRFGPDTEPDASIGPELPQPEPLVATTGRAFEDQVATTARSASPRLGSGPFAKDLSPASTDWLWTAILMV